MLNLNYFEMRNVSLMTVVMLAASFCFAACGKSFSEKEIVGTYVIQGFESAGVYEFTSDKQFINTGTSEGCVFESTGTWKLDGDKLIIENDKDSFTIDFEESVSEEEQEIISAVLEETQENAPDRYEYDIVEVTDEGMELEIDGTTFTYVRQ